MSKTIHLNFCHFYHNLFDQNKNKTCMSVILPYPVIIVGECIILVAQKSCRNGYFHGDSNKEDPSEHKADIHVCSALVE